MALIAIMFLTGCTKDRPPTIDELKEGGAKAEVTSPFPEEKPTKPDMFETKTVLKFPGTLPDAERLNKAARITTNKGEIVILLLGDEAPLATSNFIYLARQKFYDGLTFHRVEPGFVVQGGDPNGNGMGGPGYKFPDEPVKRAYAKGIVAMANSGPNTNGSQFFITLQDLPRLPPLYTIFGGVVRGMDVVQKIQPGDVMTSVEIVSVRAN